MQSDWDPIFWHLDTPPVGSTVWVFKTNSYLGREPFQSIQMPSGITLRFIVKGKGMVKIEGKEFSAEQGQIFCAIPGISIHFYDDPANLWEWYEIQLFGPGAMPMVHACGCLEHQPVYRPQNPELTLLRFKRIHQLFKGDRNNPHAVLSALHQIVDSCLLAKVPELSLNPSELLIERAIDILNSMPIHGINVSQLSKSVGVDRTTLQRAFKKVHGLSPMDYLKKLRIQKGKEYLNATDLSLETISKAIGFANEKYFSRCFREAVGLPPGQWRQQNSVSRDRPKARSMNKLDL